MRRTELVGNLDGGIREMLRDAHRHNARKNLVSGLFGFPSQALEEIQRVQAAQAEMDAGLPVTSYPTIPPEPYTPPAPSTPTTYDNEEEKRRQRRRRRRRLVRKCMQEARRAKAQMLARMNPQQKKMWRKRKRKFCQKQAARQVFHPDWQKKGI